MADPRRIARLCSLIKERVAEVLQRDMNDPDLGFVTVTRVELDREIAHCTVYWSALGDAREKSKSARALARARGFLERSIGKTLPTRTIPRLGLVYDASIEGAIRVDEILRDLEDERGTSDEDPD